MLIMGSNMAERHPVAFRWPLKAKTERGAVLSACRPPVHAHFRHVRHPRAYPRRQRHRLPGCADQICHRERRDGTPIRSSRSTSSTTRTRPRS
ncbi:MAG: hypothetical protein MZW92_71410 [Comamonadaceae bacterium]|nr:hypothetical protein [Comamonadaceae bacterium]